MKHDVVIVGGGLGGLECACLLAQRGCSVVVLEQGRQAGGALQGYRRGASVFDTGFHYVGGLAEGQSLHEPFKRLGLLDLPWHRLSPEGFDRVAIGTEDFWLAEGFESFARQLAERFPHERAALTAYIDMLQRPDQIDTSRGAYDYLTETFSDPLLVDVLSGAAMKVELRRASLPLFTFAHCQAPFVESSWRLRGDGGLIARRLLEQIAAYGGQVCCGQRVEALLASGRRLTAARLASGQQVEGRLFVSSLHPATTCRLLCPQPRGIFVRRMAGLANTHGMFTVSLKLKPRTVRYFNWNQYVYDKPGVWDAQHRGVMVSARVPADGGEWAEQIDLLRPMPPTPELAHYLSGERRRDASYRATKERLADECMALAEGFLPGLARNTEQRYTSTPLTWHDYTLTPGGSAYGVRHDYHSPLTTMLSVRTPVPNLLLTGQSLTMHGLQGVTMTALRTVEACLGEMENG